VDRGEYSRLVPVTVFVDPRLGYDYSGQEQGFTIFPNPGRERFEIRSGMQMSDVLLTVVDVSGRLILEKKLDGYREEVYLEDPSAGIYLFRLTGKHGTETHRIIIQ
jgi:hypothetical protein